MGGPCLSREIFINVMHGFTDQLFARVAQSPAGGIVDVNYLGIRRDPEHGVNSAIHAELRQPQR